MFSNTDFFNLNNWNIEHTIHIPPRKEEVFNISDLPISTASRRFLTNCFPNGIYRHQKEAIQQYLSDKNICISTGTASGKSLSFYVAAIEEFIINPSARIIAIYPLKALGREQEGRWREAIKSAGMTSEVGRIDGQVPADSRIAILRKSQILILTPDIIHAWLFSNISDKSVIRFLKDISLVIVDEVHSYTGVFGSNAAFLFRRLQHVMDLLGSSAKYICASATISEPVKHLKKLFGLDFVQIGPELDTSPRHGVDIQLVTPSRSSDLLTEVSNLLLHLAGQTSMRFIAFVDSRKQTEHLSAIITRAHDKEEREEEFRLDHLERLNVLPYRSGYEAGDRDIIQDRLSRGTLKGVISTSALELGIDIPYLDTAVLVSVPRSSTSLLQRIGRIGRKSHGRVIVINTGNVNDEASFSNPANFLDRPLAEGALYLENIRIQYIHVLCLARHGGEHDQICTALNRTEETEFTSSVDWPENFVNLCKQERIGEIPSDLQTMKAESGDDPNHVFPLRDVESQFRVENKQGPEIRSLGSLSYGQLMREAYPGAVYYYTTRPFRVCKVNVHSKVVQVRREKNRYFTKPNAMPTLVFPNLAHGNIYNSKKFGDLIVAECNLQIRESLLGYKERRGPNEFTIEYPTDHVASGIYFPQQRFTRNYFTTGVVISHPELNRDGVDCGAIANLLYEVFLILIPFERQDVSFAVDKHRIQRGVVAEGSRFLTIYDQTYGSLRLSGRILESRLLSETLSGMIKLLQDRDIVAVNSETAAAINALYESSLKEGVNLSFDPDVTSQPSCERVILPESKGVDINRNNEEFEVSGVFFNPSMVGLSYRGRHVSTLNRTVVETIPLRSLKEIPGESKVGFYNYDTGEITDSQYE